MGPGRESEGDLQTPYLAFLGLEGPLCTFDAGTRALAARSPRYVGVGHSRAVELAAAEVVAPVVVLGASAAHSVIFARTSSGVEVADAVDGVRRYAGACIPLPEQSLRTGTASCSGPAARIAALGTGLAHLGLVVPDVAGHAHALVLPQRRGSLVDLINSGAISGAYRPSQQHQEH